jgi:hypothetical protein
MNQVLASHPTLLIIICHSGVRLPRLWDSRGKKIVHPSSFRLHPFNRPVAESTRFDRLQLRGQCRHFTDFPLQPFMVNRLPEHFMHRRNARHSRHRMCID